MAIVSSFSITNLSFADCGYLLTIHDLQGVCYTRNLCLGNRALPDGIETCD
ncbi:MAG TPA: hypothetical protein VNI60_09460 [Pyrinomonadaceae bacterium]|nr:hypothetical protein [Pyrinomonadaceae bacterium]